MAVLALASLLVACDGWEFFESDQALVGDEPFQLSVLAVETCPLPAELDPKRVTIVSYRVRLRGNHPQGVPANYFYASLLTTDGNRYLADFPGCTPLLSGPPLEKGEAAEGFLNFPIPPSATADKLVFSPALSGEMSESAKHSAYVEIALSASGGPELAPPGEEP